MTCIHSRSLAHAASKRNSRCLRRSCAYASASSRRCSSRSALSFFASSAISARRVRCGGAGCRGTRAALCDVPCLVGDTSLPDWGRVACFSGDTDGVARAASPHFDAGDWGDRSRPSEDPLGRREREGIGGAIATESFKIDCSSRIPVDFRRRFGAGFPSEGVPLAMRLARPTDAPAAPRSEEPPPPSRSLAVCAIGSETTVVASAIAAAASAAATALVGGAAAVTSSASVAMCATPALTHSGGVCGAAPSEHAPAPGLSSPITAPAPSAQPAPAHTAPSATPSMAGGARRATWRPGWHGAARPRARARARPSGRAPAAGWEAVRRRRRGGTVTRAARARARACWGGCARARGAACGTPPPPPPSQTLPRGRTARAFPGSARTSPRMHFRRQRV